jgi:replication-associated recombination protein RarA
MQSMFPTKFKNSEHNTKNNENDEITPERKTTIYGELGMINENQHFQNFHESPLNINENIKQKLDFFLRTQKIPHIIFHGSSGTGKRTIVYDFINRIYGFDKQKIKSNVMFVNCAHGKGIKFIREDLKFFAKTNIQSNSGVMFKSIVLLNADFLTIDAQSALRRCIELFSHNTRFFIVVENNHKLLNPILSRFCEIYVPEHFQNGEIVNLHQYDLKKKMNMQFHENEKQQYIQVKLEYIHQNSSTTTHTNLVDLSINFYENGISTLDIIHFIEKTHLFSDENKINYIAEFYRIKSEYRCEKLLMLYLFDMLYMRTK